MSLRALAAAFILLATPAAASEADECRALITAAAQLTDAMPAGDLSRRFAEHELDTARLELDNGETDECTDFVERARYIAANRPYVLRPGETLGVQAPR